MATIYYDIDYGSPLFTATLEDNSVSPPVVVQTQNNLSIGQHWFTGVDDGSYIIRIIGSDDCEIVLDADVYCLTTTTTTICNVSLHIIEWECKDVTTTTTTTIDSVENCDVFLVTGVELSGDYKLYTYNPQTKSLTYRFSYATYSRDVAATNTRLWIPDDTMSAIKEYIITLNPWSCTYNRSLVVLGDAINGAGLEIVYADDVANKYIFVGEKAGTNELRHVTFDNSTIGVVTTLFTIDTNVILGDISYDASLDYYTISAKDAFDKRLIICYNATGTPLWTLDVTEEANRIYGLFIYNNTLYGIDELMSSSLVYEITNTLSLYDTLDGIEVQGAAQSFYCGSYLTTTTTTSEPTTTTTTTTLYCEGPLCDTTLTVDEYLEGEEAVYGFDRIFIGFGSLNPDCEDINYLVWVNDETPQLQLQTSQCYNSPIVIEIDGVQYTLISEDEGNSFFLNTSNPFPATGQTCHVRICGSECTTTTSTTEEYVCPATIWVCGAGETAANQGYTESCCINGRNIYQSCDSYPSYIIYWETTGGLNSWVLIENGGDHTAFYYSDEDVATPDLTTEWHTGFNVLNFVGSPPMPTVQAGECTTITTTTEDGTTTTTTTEEVTTTTTTSEEFICNNLGSFYYTSGFYCLCCYDGSSMSPVYGDTNDFATTTKLRRPDGEGGCDIIAPYPYWYREVSGHLWRYWDGSSFTNEFDCLELPKRFCISGVSVVNVSESCGYNWDDCVYLTDDLLEVGHYVYTDEAKTIVKDGDGEWWHMKEYGGSEEYAVQINADGYVNSIINCDDITTTTTTSTTEAPTTTTTTTCELPEGLTPLPIFVSISAENPIEEIFADGTWETACDICTLWNEDLGRNVQGVFVNVYFTAFEVGGFVYSEETCEYLEDGFYTTEGIIEVVDGEIIYIYSYPCRTTTTTTTTP